MGPQVRDDAISGSPFREEAVLTLFERLTHFYSSLRALAAPTIEGSRLGPPGFLKKNAGRPIFVSLFPHRPPKTVLWPDI